jgi:hypothetical protein
MLYSASGYPVAKGTKIKKSLYKMNIKLCEGASTNIPTGDLFVFTANTPTLSWETWHKQFGYIGYKGLQWLKDLNLVQGLNVDPNSPKLDCIVCTEAKQTQEPYKKIMCVKQYPGELMYIDVWGKYDTVSIG